MRLALPRLVCPLRRSAVHLGKITSGYSLGESLWSLRSDTLPGHLGSGQWGVALSGQKGNHDSWVKCATSTECYENWYISHARGYERPRELHLCDGTSQVIRLTYSCSCPTDLRQPCRCPWITWQVRYLLFLPYPRAFHPSRRHYKHRRYENVEAITLTYLCWKVR
jgi:hypothetical protein